MTDVAFDSGTYFLEVDTRFLADHGFIVLRTHPSRRLAPVPFHTLSEQVVPARMMARAPGQTWPEGFNRPQMVRLPYKGKVPEDYEEVFGFRLGAQVLHAQALAYAAEASGKTHTGMEWRDPNPDAIRAEWRRTMDQMHLLWERFVMEEEREGRH